MQVLLRTYTLYIQLIQVYYSSQILSMWFYILRSESSGGEELTSTYATTTPTGIVSIPTTTTSTTLQTPEVIPSKLPLEMQVPWNITTCK